MSYIDDINNERMALEAEERRKKAEAEDVAMQAEVNAGMPQLDLQEPKSNLSYKDLVDRFSKSPEPAAEQPAPILEQARDVLKARTRPQPPVPAQQPQPTAPEQPAPMQQAQPEDAELQKARTVDRWLNLGRGLSRAGQGLGEVVSAGKFKADPNEFKDSNDMTDQLTQDRGIVQAKREQDYQKKLMDPQSDTNKAFKKLLANSNFDLPEGMTMYDAIKSGMLPTLLAGKSREEIASLKLDMATKMAAIPKPMTEYQSARIDQSEKRLGASELNAAASQYNKNLGKLSDSLGQGNRIFELIGSIKSGKLTGTPQELDTITQKMSQLIASGGSSAAADRAHLRYKNLETMAAEAKQFLSSNPSAGIPPKILQEIENESKIIYDELHKEAQSRVNALAEAETNPAKAEYYGKRFNKYVEGHGARSSKEESKPKTVMQNGHKYTLNEETGQYE